MERQKYIPGNCKFEKQTKILAVFWYIIWYIIYTNCINLCFPDVSHFGDDLFDLLHFIWLEIFKLGSKKYRSLCLYYVIHQINIIIFNFQV